MDEARIIAWIDGDLSPEEASEVAAAVAADPDLAARADRHRRVKARFTKAFGGIIEEAARMPAPARPAAVVSIASARAKRNAAAKAAAPPRPKRNWAVPAAVAASLAIGIAVGLQVRPMPGIGDEPRATILGEPIAGALTRQPSGADGTARIALSFHDKGGLWCRRFAATHLAGIACREGNGWRLRYVTPEAGDREVGLGSAVGAMIAGAPADAAQERAAIAAGWR
jgi:hypothetical protein